jgi:serine/threonine protein phosphatase PrpC
MTIRTDVELANATDIGCERSVNEDYYVFIEPRDEADFARRGRLVLVADGVGGHKGGEIASRLAAHTIRDVFLSSTAQNPRETLIEGFLQAHRRIQEHAASSPDLDGMATTCTSAILRDGQLTVGHIGDSRLYLIRDGRAQQISRDHTVVNELLREGVITPEQALTHENLHVLTTALGVGHTLGADFPEEPLALQPEDILLFCSDGLHGLLNDDELVSVTVDQPLTEACAELIAWAKVRGGPDNITIQLVRIMPVNPSPVTGGL